MIRALAITVSNRAAAGVYEDRSGPVLVSLLSAAGCAVDGPVVVVLTDAPEWDRHAIFDTRAVNVEPLA